MLRYKNDLTLSEISEVLGVPSYTVKSQPSRALMALRQKFPND